jgi:HK97 family phage major capsid protein
MKLADLREARANKITEMRSIVSGADSAGRDLSIEESGRFDALKAETEALEARIGRAEAMAEMERRAAGSPVNPEMQREVRTRYSIARATQGQLNGKLSGLEAEAHAELSRGREARGVMVPTDILLGAGPETRDGQIVSDSTAGGYMVATALGAMQDRFRPRLMVEAMGATVLRGLVGNLDLPNLAASGSVSWLNENSDATRTAATFSAVNMAPNTVGGEYRVSRRLLLQSAESIESILSRDLSLLLATALDAAAINGSGATQPQGILQNGSVATVTYSGTLGDTTADLIAKTEGQNVPGGAFLTNSVVMNLARKIKDGDGLVIPVGSTFYGQRLEVSNQIPTSLGAGTKSAILWGLWSELVVAYWGGTDILANPFHSDVASSGGVLLHAFLDADVAVRRPEAFAYALV